MSANLHIVANLTPNLEATWIQEGPSWSQDAPKMPQDASKMAPRHPKLEPRWPQERPSRAKMRPRCFQDGLPRVQVQYQRSGHAAATYPADVATGRPLIVGRSKAPQVAQLSLNWASTWLKMASTWPQHGSKMASRCFKLLNFHSTWLQHGSTWPQHGLNMAQDSLNMLNWTFRNHKNL